jgi:hypothetical protein
MVAPSMAERTKMSPGGPFAAYARNGLPNQKMRKEGSTAYPNLSPVTTETNRNKRKREREERDTNSNSLTRKTGKKVSTSLTQMTMMTAWKGPS